MSMRLMVIGCLTTCRDRPLTTFAFVFQKTHTRSDIAMTEFLKLCILLWRHYRNHDLINGIKITAELNERCEYIYTLIGPKNKNVKTWQE